MEHFLTTAGSYFASIVDSIPGVYQPQDDLESDITRLAFRTVMGAAAALVVLTIIAVIINDRVPKLKMPVFVLIVITMLGSTFTLIGSTVYLNVKSESGGPIHWHADFEFWACGNEMELRDPTGFLSNKIGTSVLHEHNDHRIHLEGVAVEKEIDASLGKFMHVIGGAVTEDALVMPLNADPAFTFEDEVDGDGASSTNPQYVDDYIMQDGLNGRVAYFQDGQTCGGQEADMQVFVYNYDSDSKTYEQTKLDNPRDYVITEDPNVPPGDCIIFEFDVQKDKTDKLCEQYGIRDIDRCDQFGVAEDQRAICEITQVNYDPSFDYTTQTEMEVTTIPEVEINDPTNNDDSSIPEGCFLQTAGINPEAEGSEARVICESQDFDLVCPPYFDQSGIRNSYTTITELGDGSILDVEINCLDYQNSLQANTGDADA